MKMKSNIVVSGINYITASKIDPEDFIKEIDKLQKGPHEMHRVQKITAAVCLRALKDAGVTITENNSDRIAIFFVTAYGTEEFRVKFYKTLRESQPTLTSPSVFPFTNPNSIAANLSVLLGTKGVNLTFVGGLDASSTAMTVACDTLSSGKADIALVVGEGFLCEDFNEELRNQGFKQESCASIILEREKDVISRGKKVRTLIKGCGHGVLDSSDRYDSHGRAFSAAGILKIIRGEKNEETDKR